MARRFHLQTVVGSVIDPMADKLLMTVMTVSLAAKGLMPGEWTVIRQKAKPMLQTHKRPVRTLPCLIHTLFHHYPSSELHSSARFELTGLQHIWQRLFSAATSPSPLLLSTTATHHYPHPRPSPVIGTFPCPLPKFTPRPFQNTTLSCSSS